MTVSFRNKPEPPPLSVPFLLHSCLDQELPGDGQDSEFAAGRTSLPRAGESASEHMMRNLSPTSREQANSTVNRGAEPQDKLSKVVRDNCIALDYLLAEQ